ncbi:SH3 domain-containing protein 21 isoform X2 [Scyliorhinus torazame]|uniref:SH3 domain-containing protein 21 isoform X2 n=1 Tax=Scyliorhinus torazame TaxID=75743 RepID=UPI003B5C07AA
MVEFIVVSCFETQEDDELSLQIGDVIKNTKCTEEEGWWEGEINGRRGRFPRIFVQEVPPSPVEPENNMQPPSVHRKRAVKKRMQRWCEVVISYSPSKSEELEINVGDVIEILDEIEDGWWIGRMNGKTGRFPSNFVIEMDNTEGKAQCPVTKSGKEYYKAISDYVASTDAELSLHIGDVILILKKETEEYGWWEGYLNGTQGLFPNNCVVPYLEDTEMEKGLPPRVTTDVDGYEKKKPKSEWSEPAVKPNTMPPRKVPPPVKVKPALVSLPNKVNGEQGLSPQEHSKSARDKASDSDLVPCDTLAGSAEKLNHLTTDRPKHKGRRPPSQFVAPTADVKWPPHPTMPARVTAPTSQLSEQPTYKMLHATAVKPSIVLPHTSNNLQKELEDEDKETSLEALRAEVRSLQLSLDLLRNLHLRDITDLKEEIAHERHKRNALQVEVEKLKKVTANL